MNEEPAVESDAVLEWRAALERRLDVLRNKILGLESLRTMAEVAHESEILTAVVAWYETGGNITRAAERLKTSRSALRKRITAWRNDHPLLEPTPLHERTKPIRSYVRDVKTQGRPRVEGEAP